MSDDDDPFAGLDALPDDVGPVAGDPALGALGDAELLAACAKLPLNDVGNAGRFCAYYGPRVMWVARVGWHVWSDTHWAIDPDEAAVRRLSQQLGGQVLAEIGSIRLEKWQMDALARKRALLDAVAAGEGAEATPEAQAAAAEARRQLVAIERIEKSLGSRRKEHRAWARASGNKARVDAALTESAPHLCVDVSALDAGALDFNTLSGVLRFSVQGGGDAGFSRVADVALVPHDPGQRISKLAPVVWDPEATCPRFDAFFEEVQPDPEMRAFILRWLGLSMTALPVQAMAFWYGAGANGKSVMADLVARLMGSYAASAKIKSLTGVDRRGGGDATPDLMLLVGARFVRASEPKEGEALQEDLIKELTGGEPMMVRALHTNFIEFRPHFKLTVSGNHKPVVRGTDDGIWRRLMMVPWDVQIPEGRRIAKDVLDAELWAEAPGVLNRLAAGLIDYLEGGLQVPGVVSDATREFREESDPVGAFLDACCLVTGEAADSIGARELGEAYNWWLSDRGEGEWTPRTVAIRLKEKAGRWRQASTGRTFVARKASTMSYGGIRFLDAFGKAFRDLPRDATGRILRARKEAQDG